MGYVLCAFIVYFSFVASGYSIAAAMGFFGDGSQQRVEDVVIALVAFGITMTARWQLLRLAQINKGPDRRRR